MSDLQFYGRSPDGNKVILDVHSDGKEQVAFVWVTRIPYKGTPYYVLKALESWGEEISPGDELVFGFSGNIDTITGKFTLVVDDDVLDYVAKETVRLEQEQGNKTSSKPKTQSKPKPSKPNPTREQKREAAHHKVTNYGALNEDVAKPLPILRNIFYVLGMIWGLLVGPAVTTFFVMKGNSTGSADWIMPTIFSVYLWPFFLVGFINLIAAFRDHGNMHETAHNSAIVIGFVTLNPFSIIGGYLNYRYRVASNKKLPEKE